MKDRRKGADPRGAVSLDPNDANARNIQSGLNTLVMDLWKCLTTLSASDSKKWEQCLAELSASREYLKAPIAKRDILNELLPRPLEQMAQEASTENTRTTAERLLLWYLEMKAHPGNG